MRSKINICSIILVNLAMVNSFGIVSIKNLGEDELVDVLANLLDNRKGERTHNNRIEVRSSRKDLHDAHNKYERERHDPKHVIKFGQHGEEVNFMTNAESIYKTLVKIHKKKPIFLAHNNQFNIKFDDALRVGELADSDYKKLNKPNMSGDVAKFWQKLKALKHKYKENAEEKVKKLRSAVLISPRNTKLAYWNRLKNALKRTGEREKKKAKVEKLKNWIIRALENDESLRSRSGEEHDPLAPGKVPVVFDENQEETTSKPHGWLPSYSFWNYWTYKSQLHQDACRGNLIRVGDKCIRGPPH